MKDTNPLRSFEERNVRVYFGGLAISAAGTWAQLTAVILLIRKLGGGGVELGIVTACQFIPVLLLGLYAGAYADGVDRHRLTIKMQTAMGVQALVLAGLTFAGLATIPLLYGITLLFGVLNAFDNPARRTFSTELVPADRLANIIALSTSVMIGGRMIGPAIAALLVSSAGAGWVFALNGLTFLAFLYSMARMDASRFHPIERSKPSATPIRDGLREVWSVPELRIIIVLFAVVSTFGYNMLVGIPLLVTDRLMSEDSLFGWLLSTLSVGNVVGSLLIARLTTLRSSWMYGSGALLAVSLGALSFATTPLVAFLLVFPFGLATTAFVNSSTVLIQQRTDPAMRSRILALTTVLFLGSTPIGGPITGAIGDAYGGLWANLYGALIVGVAIVVGAGAMLVLRSAGRPVVSS